MSKKQFFLPRSCSPPAGMEKTESNSSRDSDSPIHWETLMSSDSQRITNMKPSSWDNSDEELPLAFDKNNSRGHIYSSHSVSSRKSVTAEINELKKQFFMAAVLETNTEPEIEDLREKLEKSLRNDRRKSPARMRRRTKSSSSSSTAMEMAIQNSPKQGDELLLQYETTFDNMENFAPLLELDSKFYLDQFFAELRHKRISILESTGAIADERDDKDCQEILLEDSDDLISLSDGGYYNRTSRKLSQILEVEENKKDSDKDGEENSENNGFFFKVIRKSDDSDNSSVLTARNKKNENFENVKEKKDKYKSSSAGSADDKHGKHAREATAIAIATELGNDFISLTAKTGTTHFESSKKKDVKKNKAESDRVNDGEDVNWTLVENLKLDLLKSSENSTPRKCSRAERNSDLGSKRSSRDGSLQSPKFLLNVGQQSSRSLKVEDIKTPHSTGKNSEQASDRSIKNHTSICGSTVQEAEKNIFIDLKSPSIVSHSSNRSLELQDILLDHGMNTNRYSQRTSCDNEIRDHEEETFNQLDLPYGSNNSEYSSRSVHSKSSRSSKSYRLLSKVNERHNTSHRSEKAETLEKAESTKSSGVTPRTELELLKQTNMPRLEKSYDYSSKSVECTKLTPRELKTTNIRANDNYVEDIQNESENHYKSLTDNETVLGRANSERVDEEQICPISSKCSEKFLKSQSSSRSEIIISESLDKATQKDSFEELEQDRLSSPKSAILDHLNNLDCTSHTKSTKSKSSPNSCTSEEKTLLNVHLNIEKSGEVKISGRTDGNNVIEMCENTSLQRLNIDSDNDQRLSVINEVYSEDNELSKIPKSTITSKPSSESQVRGDMGGRTPKSHLVTQRSVKSQSPNKAITKLEPTELWNDLIETFNEDKNQPFNWQDKVFGFLNTNHNNATTAEKGSSPPATENVNILSFKKEKQGDDKDFILLKRQTENTFRFHQRSERSSEKHPEKKEQCTKNLDLGIENKVREKIKNDNDVDSLYFFEVKKTGNFGIGEFGDVTCWNLGVSFALEEGKPKGDGDGVQCHKEKPILNQSNTENSFKIQKESEVNLKDVGSCLKFSEFFQANDDLNLLNFSRKELKPSKSDNCLSSIDFSQCKFIDFSTEKHNTSNAEQKQMFNILGNRKRKAVSSISSEQYSSSECLSDDNQGSEFESVRRSASLTDIAAQLRKTIYQRSDSKENIYNSRSPLFEKMAEEQQNRDVNLNLFLARKKQKEKIDPKSNWLILKHSRGKTHYRENKKSKSRLKIDKNLIKKDSKEYLSFRSRHSIPVLKLRDSNCFQNFYKRVISVFCLTSSSSLPTSK